MAWNPPFVPQERITALNGAPARPPIPAGARDVHRCAYHALCEPVDIGMRLPLDQQSQLGLEPLRIHAVPFHSAP